MLLYVSCVAPPELLLPIHYQGIITGTFPEHYILVRLQNVKRDESGHQLVSLVSLGAQDAAVSSIHHDLQAIVQLHLVDKRTVFIFQLYL